MRQLRLYLTDGLGGALALRDILGHDQDDGSVLDQHRSGRLANPERFPILADFAQFPTHRSTEIFEANGFIPPGARSVSLMEQDVHGTANQFVHCVSELLGAEGIHGQDRAGRIHHEEW